MGLRTELYQVSEAERQKAGEFLWVISWDEVYVSLMINNNNNTSSSRASRGRKFQKKKELYSKERICL